MGDNARDDRYAYLVVVRTGNIKTAGTTSNVVMKLNGSISESRVRRELFIMSLSVGLSYYFNPSSIKSLIIIVKSVPIFQQYGVSTVMVLGNQNSLIPIKIILFYRFMSFGQSDLLIAFVYF